MRPTAPHRRRSVGPPSSVGPLHNHWFTGLRWRAFRSRFRCPSTTGSVSRATAVGVRVSSPGPLSEWCGELADAGPVVMVAQRGGGLGQRGVVKVASVGPVLPLVEGVAETPSVVGDAFEVVEVVEHSSSGVHAVVIVDDVAEFVDPAPGRRREFLGSGESAVATARTSLAASTSRRAERRCIRPARRRPAWASRSADCAWFTIRPAASTCSANGSCAASAPGNSRLANATCSRAAARSALRSSSRC